jgi:hypothetical protein
MEADKQQTENLDEVIDAFKKWLKVNYLTNRASFASDGITIYSAESLGFGVNLIAWLFLTAIPVALIIWLVLSPEASLNARILFFPVAILFLVFIISSLGKANGQTALILNFKQGTVKSATTSGTFRRTTASMEVNFKEITKVQLWRDAQPDGGLPAYDLDVWVNKRRIRLIRFQKTPTYTDVEQGIAEQAKHILDAALRECSPI